jgi:hypothetical protein
MPGRGGWPLVVWVLVLCELTLALAAAWRPLSPYLPVLAAVLATDNAVFAAACSYSMARRLPLASLARGCYFAYAVVTALGALYVVQLACQRGLLGADPVVQLLFVPLAGGLAAIVSIREAFAWLYVGRLGLDVHREGAPFGSCMARQAILAGGGAPMLLWRSAATGLRQWRPAEGSRVAVALGMQLTVVASLRYGLPGRAAPPAPWAAAAPLLIAGLCTVGLNWVGRVLAALLEPRRVAGSAPVAPEVEGAAVTGGLAPIGTSTREVVGLAWPVQVLASRLGELVWLLCCFAVERAALREHPGGDWAPGCQLAALALADDRTIQRSAALVNSTAATSGGAGLRLHVGDAPWLLAGAIAASPIAVAALQCAALQLGDRWPSCQWLSPALVHRPSVQLGQVDEMGVLGMYQLGFRILGEKFSKWRGAGERHTSLVWVWWLGFVGVELFGLLLCLVVASRPAGQAGLAQLPLPPPVVAVLLVLSCALHLHVCRSDPGFVVSPRAAGVARVEEDWCAVCAAPCGPGVHHCRRCGRCVAGRDHHCRFIDNCVGSNNARAFTVFMGVFLVTCGASLVDGLAAGGLLRRDPSLRALVGTGASWVLQAAVGAGCVTTVAFTAAFAWLLTTWAGGRTTLDVVYQARRRAGVSSSRLKPP